MTLLKDDEWSQWSDREIARHCAVHHDTVGTIRRSLAKTDSEPPEPRTYTTSDYSLFEVPEWHHMAGRKTPR